jgi:hypothetical protein
MCYQLRLRQMETYRAVWLRRPIYQLHAMFDEHTIWGKNPCTFAVTNSIVQPEDQPLSITQFHTGPVQN